MQKEIEKSLEVLKAGGIILYPTDTIWGLGCDATNAEAVEKIIQLKKREGKSFIVLLDNLNDLFRYVKDVPEIAYDLIELADKPLTVVFEAGKGLAPNVLNEDGSVGIRIVKHPFCEQLIKKFRKPIVSTSANISGQPSAMCYEEVAEEIKQGVDYVVDYERSKKSASPSSIIKLSSGGVVKVLRK
ncbi:L-threonylcarbamoyladenylate synthase [Solitalea lacus]|uniref:L-threonylcarbamoyladenylate synthase n=1 Tax=Solitalea lacus TaxID=2911172 RepID=UPI001EDAE3D5|nr:L-threonylcarbamoyladenylate synthase [Solitalea lacus]UKJ08790.1 threonylcarbamoyl-AMP synthase [Solitalea lacus]